MSSSSGQFRKVTTKTFMLMKEKGIKISALTSYDFLTSKLLDQAGIDLILVGDSLGNVFQGNETTLPVTMDEMIYHTKAVTRGVARAMVIVDMPFMSYQLSTDEAFRNAGRIMKETAAGGVKLEGGKRIADAVKKITDAGIPVMGHIGLMPQSIHQYGSYKERGTTQEEADEILSDALILEQSGAFSLVIEKVPSLLAKKVSEAVKIPTIGIGAGQNCDGQILVSSDMLGLNIEFKPRFVRHYLNLAKDIDNAVRKFIVDVKKQDFPSEKESY
ncbi:MAG: 3-methyl-2-oxobutanoate hydroxymethyltransferase [Chlorobiaceae bacterium]|nr:3-methyl-2-oxobutanoate hydroxymethyltransferase [Chlorobiaceae bacterium]MBA4309867.1 3-methyl-2-oxobutanoate hydroxymethyltransferase [Chlorobiaceae bacterium]